LHLIQCSLNPLRKSEGGVDFVAGDVVQVMEGTDLAEFMPDVVGFVGYVVAVEYFDEGHSPAVIVKLIGWEDVIFFAGEELALMSKSLYDVEQVATEV